jgi:hypothetical protein
MADRDPSLAGAPATPELESAEDEAPAGSLGLLQLLLEEHESRLAAAPRPARIEGVVVGVLSAIEPSGAARVTFPGGPAGGSVARAMTALGAGDVGCEVALLFEGGDPAHPIVMGKMHVAGAAPVDAGQPAGRPRAPVDAGQPAGRPRAPVDAGQPAGRPRAPVDATRDGERIEVRAEREIVLSCGDASITLTRAGKILIRGKYVLSRSSGVHRIQGGTVQIN